MSANASTEGAHPKGFRVVQTLSSADSDNGAFDVVCLEFANYFMVFATSEPKIGTLIEAAPDDIVDLGNPTTYSTTVVFGRDELSLHLLARRLVEVVQRRILLAVSGGSLTLEAIRTVEAEVRKGNLAANRQIAVGTDMGSLCTQMVPLSLNDISADKVL
ncbi:proteasome assembly chaperone 3-like [Paramacrobiotus metropolitanus]|uniref:proteasome assembly chaperone 3-like n=1 Tax=Paramacrobiotus metropolitanus TaxID=2943436 RepID=UPI002445D0C2|nr:proteasome assembly chaperone 3-like [Paramacrobiotus metropolitanus]